MRRSPMTLTDSSRGAGAEEPSDTSAGKSLAPTAPKRQGLGIFSVGLPGFRCRRRGLRLLRHVERPSPPAHPGRRVLRRRHVCWFPRQGSQFRHIEQQIDVLNRAGYRCCIGLRTQCSRNSENRCPPPVRPMQAPRVPRRFHRFGERPAAPYQKGCHQRVHRPRASPRPAESPGLSRSLWVPRRMAPGGKSQSDLLTCRRRASAAAEKAEACRQHRPGPGDVVGPAAKACKAWSERSRLRGRLGFGRPASALSNCSMDQAASPNSFQPHHARAALSVERRRWFVRPNHRARPHRRNGSQPIGDHFPGFQEDAQAHRHSNERGRRWMPRHRLPPGDGCSGVCKRAGVRTRNGLRRPSLFRLPQRRGMGR